VGASFPVAILGIAVIVVAAAIFVLAFVFKRPDVSWYEIFILGPFVALKLERYVLPDRVETMVKLVILWVVLFIALGLAVAVFEFR
jgi:hypothetical protein